MIHVYTAFKILKLLQSERERMQECESLISEWAFMYPDQVFLLSKCLDRLAQIKS